MPRVRSAPKFPKYAPPLAPGKFAYDIDLSLAKCNSTLGEIVGRKLHAHFVTGNDTDKVLPHLTCNMGNDFVATVDFDTKTSIRQGLCYCALNFERFFFLLRH